MDDGVSSIGRGSVMTSRTGHSGTHRSGAGSAEGQRRRRQDTKKKKGGLGGLFAGL